jgi:hypothetical protein
LNVKDLKVHQSRQRLLPTIFCAAKNMADPNPSTPLVAAVCEANRENGLEVTPSQRRQPLTTNQVHRLTNHLNDACGDLQTICKHFVLRRYLRTFPSTSSTAAAAVASIPASRCEYVSRVNAMVA